MADRFDEMAREHNGCDGSCADTLCAEELAKLAALLRKVHDEARAEADRLRELFDDAGQGEHNVLALVDHYQRSSMEADERLLAARKVVEAAREYRDECDQKCACVFTARLLAALDEADKAVVG